MRMKITMGLNLKKDDFVKYNNRYYTIQEDRDGNPMFLRVYLSSNEMLQQSIIDLERNIKQVNISVSVPL